MFEPFDLPDAGVFRGFEPDTFTFLAELTTDNTRQWMAANEDRYRRVLREPLRSLFRALAPVIERLDPHLETNAKYGRVLSPIRRRWPQETAFYHHTLWGAFYRADRARQTDAQLYVVVSADGIHVGIGAERTAAEVMRYFRHNLQQASDLFFECLIQADLPMLNVYVTDEQEATHAVSVTDIAAVSTLYTAAAIRIERHFSKDDDLIYVPEFADEVSRLFERLYPLYRFLISEDITAEQSHVTSAPASITTTGYGLAQLEADTLLTRDLLQRMETLLLDKGQIVLYGPPGTSKTHVAQCLAHYVGRHGATIRVVQFHPSFAYEEFIEGIRPHSQDGQLTYPVEAGIFRRLCDEARAHPDQRFILIIDELNRGNLPRIFGELLYLLDRRDPSEAVTLPYSQQLFSIPRNVYLIGTMNTTDRSLTALDQAVRRRFHFIPLHSDPEVLRRWLVSHHMPTMLYTAAMLAELNRRLEEDGFNWQQHIGHTYWMRPDLDERLAMLIWEHSILPTLEDLLYNHADWFERYDYKLIKNMATSAT